MFRKLVQYVRSKVLLRQLERDRKNREELIKGLTKRGSFQKKQK